MMNLLSILATVVMRVLGRRGPEVKPITQRDLHPSADIVGADGVRRVVQPKVKP